MSITSPDPYSNAKAKQALTLQVPEAEQQPNANFLNGIAQFSDRLIGLAAPIGAASVSQQKDRELAALKLQGVHRGRSCRIELEAKSEIQRLTAAGQRQRPGEAKRQAQTRLGAATKLQSIYRGRSGRKLVPGGSLHVSRGADASAKTRANQEQTRRDQQARDQREAEKSQVLAEADADEEAAAAGASELQKRAAAMRQAAQAGDADTLRHLLADGAPLDSCNKRGATALHFATQGNHTEAMLVLLDAGVDIDAQDHRGLTAAALAAAAGHTDALCMLVDDGADVELAAGAADLNWSPIMFAAANGHADAIGA